jgi:hypothetical protein
MSVTATDEFEIKADHAATDAPRVPRTLGFAFAIGVAIAIFFGLAILLLILPMYVLARTAHKLGNRFSGRRKTSSKPPAEWPPHMPPIIEGEYELVDDSRCRAKSEQMAGNPYQRCWQVAPLTPRSSDMSGRLP